MTLVPKILDMISQLDRVHRIQHISSVALQAAVAKYPGGANLVPASRFDVKWQKLRPADVLANLARTAWIRGVDDPYRLFERWASLKYLGALHGGTGVTPELGLTAATNNVRGNQRRVFSEELGIGFAIAAGARWHEFAHGGPVSVSTIDIDNLANEQELIDAGFVRPSGKRTDFIQLSQTADPSWWRVSQVEAKGTESDTYTFKQIAKAGLQLDKLRVRGVRPPGLVVGSVLHIDNSYVNVLASPTAGTSATKDVKVQPGRFGPNQVLVNLGPDVDFADSSNLLPRLADAARRASWAQLLALAGAPNLALRWFPHHGETQTPDSTQRIRVDGRRIRGLRAIFPTVDGHAEMVIGVPDELFEVMREGTARDVAQLQMGLASNRVPGGGQLDGDGDGAGATTSIGADGLFVSIRDVSDG